MAGLTVTLPLIQCHDDESVFAVARALNWQTSCVSSPSIIRHVLYRLYVNWRFLHGIEAQFLALQKGFNEVIPQHLLKSFDEKELEVRDKTKLVTVTAISFTDTPPHVCHFYLTGNQNTIKFKWILPLYFQLIVCGLGKIDISDWKSNTRLKHCTPDSNIVKWFWKAVESFDEERRARLLQFVTGSSRVPLQGFKALQGIYLTLCVSFLYLCWGPVPLLV